MPAPSSAVLLNDRTTETSLIRRLQLTLTTLVALAALVLGVVALRLWVALNHMM
jgi:hypothetical protein